ncbi:MAG TPA: ABC transporter substrate-binding protein [Chloroflexota bacterium]|jgi:peptide/nickel transport system substrate-binding protein
MSTQLTRRQALSILACGSGAALLAACTPSVPAAAPTQAAAPAGAPPVAVTTPQPAAQQPRSGGTLRFAQTANPVSIDGNSIAGGGSETAWLVFDRLTTYDQNRTPQPMLAESWDISSDYKSFKLNLRKGVQFHSGREMTSDDVKYTVLRLRESTVGSGILAGFSNWFSSIETPDKYTVLLKTDASRPTFFDAIELFNIVDKENVEGPEAKSKIVGTGPFTFVEWQNGDHFTVEKNKNYWQSGRPYLDEIISSVRDQQTMDLQLESGALDVVKIPNVDDFVRLKSDSAYQAIVHPASGTFFEVGFNTKRPPFDDKRVRQAFNYAMDRKRFAETIWRGTSTPLSLPWSTTSPAYDASKNGVYTYDLDRAKSLLQQAGVSGLETGVLVNGIGAPQVLAFSQIFQASLAQIGVKLNIQNVEPAVWVDTLINKKPDYTGLWAGSDQIAQLSPSTLFQLSPGWRLDNNHSNFVDPMWTDLVNTALSEVDPGKQKDLYGRLNDYILDQSFTTPIATYPYTILMRSNVNGTTYLLHNGGLNFTETYLS